MAKKKTTSRKTTKKSGTKRKKAPIRALRRKKGRSSPTKASSSTRARKRSPSPRKRVAKKKKTKKRTVVRKKPTKKERRAAHPQGRKPETNYQEARDYFGAEDRKWTPALTQELKMVFLRAYATKGIVIVGMNAADISRKTYKRWREQDEGFNEACKEAEQMATDILERVARGRAEDGVDHPVIYQGEITDTYKVYSDALMKTLLEGAAPEKYKHRTEHSGSVGRPLTLDDETKESVVSSILGMIKNKPDPK